MFKIIINVYFLIGIISTVFCVQVTANEQPQLRVVALAPHIVEMVFEIGAGDMIVGAVEYSDYPEQAKKIPRIGGHNSMQVEKILTLLPDVIIAWRSGINTTQLEQLARLGIDIVYSDAGNINDVTTELRTLGKLLGKEQQAERAAYAFEKKLTLLKKQQKNKSTIKVFYQLWPEPMMTINNTTWIHQLIEVCNAKNVFADNPTNYPQIGIENVMLAQPELIIIPDERSDKPLPDIQWQKWPEIPAVKNNHFIHVNADLLHRFSTRMLEGVTDMCRKIDNVRENSF
jgi:vitamin B12 transport system substrate-binding protein